MTWQTQLELLPQLLVNALITGSIYAIVACGLSLTYGLLKIMNFAHGHFVMVGAYTCFFFLNWLEQPLWVACIGTALFMGVLAQIILFCFITPFKHGGPLLSFVTTLSVGAVLEAVISLIFGVNTEMLSADALPESYEIGSVFITSLQITIIAAVFAILCAVAFIIHSTGFGRRVRALSQQRAAAEAIGINGAKIEQIVFAASVILASVAGILIGYETQIQPTMGTPYTIKAFAAMILGGLGNLWGTLFGSYLLGLFENLAVGLDFGAFSIPAGYRDAVAYAIILFILLVRPGGLFAKRGRKV